MGTHTHTRMNALACTHTHTAIVNGTAYRFETYFIKSCHTHCKITFIGNLSHLNQSAGY